MTAAVRCSLLVLVIAASIAPIACSEPLTFADWTVPVPEGARIIEYRHVPETERTERIEVVEDLLIARGAEPFYRPIDVDVDASGNVYVFDAGNRNIVVVGPDGGYLRTLGREGEGPGEIGMGGRVAVVGTNIVHVSRNRLNAWTPGGDVVGSHNIPFARFLLPISGTDDGQLFGIARQLDEQGVRSREVVRLSLQGDLEREYVVLPDPGSVDLVRRNGTRVSGYNTAIPSPVPTFVVSRDGDIYAVAGDEYQVFAYAPEGALRWALRTSMQRPTLTDARIDTALERLANRDERPLVPPPRRSEVDWPAELPALVGTSFVHGYLQPIRVDGHGHLYVYPFIPDAWDRSDQPVDIYAPDGERLFSGMMPIMRWDAARDDFIYAVDTDPETDEYRIVRHRLVEPFD